MFQLLFFYVTILISPSIFLLQLLFFFLAAIGAYEELKISVFLFIYLFFSFLDFRVMLIF